VGVGSGSLTLAVRKSSGVVRKSSGVVLLQYRG